MMIDPWAYPEYHSSRHHHRRKPRRSSRHHYCRHRKASSSKQQPKKEVNIDKETDASVIQNRIFNESNGKLFERKAVEEVEYNEARQIIDPIKYCSH